MLLSQQLPDWEVQIGCAGEEPETVAVTWEQVCVGIRRGLRSDEPQLWKAFGVAFAGAVEQMLVGFPGHQIGERPIDNLTQKLTILQEALTHG